MRTAITGCLCLLLLNGSAAGGWSLRTAPTGDMRSARSRHTVTMLADGRVLAAGGLEVRMLPLPGAFVLNAAEIFDPATGAWTPVEAKMTQKRWDHVAATLPDGRVLLAGGKTTFNIQGKGGKETRTTELFDPSAGTFTPGPEMDVARGQFTATSLPDGRVLLAGGQTAQVFDPRSDRFVATIALRARRVSHAAVLTEDGRVLLAGGEDGRAAATMELVDVLRGSSMMLAARLDPPVDDLGMLALESRRVLVLGGQQPNGRTVRRSQLIDLNADGAGGTSVRAIRAEIDFPGGLSDMVCAGFGPLALLAGGEADLGKRDVIAQQAWLLDTRSELFLASLELRRPHDDFDAAALGPDGFACEHMLLAGGIAPDEDYGELPHRDCEIITLVPDARPWAPQTVAATGLGLVSGQR